ncbi:GTPase IMAP family member 8-like [Podarcis raffonei]|uniref:GTPase IMAP family member 8-like n=1 Tax=Podarcis raffonei TaxID=65483 RepID=UPI002329270C|nr:GTPase IMAP family member 8-like [Podarcis raffonei]
MPRKFKILKQREINKLCKSSPYVLVLVITVGRFTPEDEEIAKMVKKVFRKKFGKRMLVLFTHKEDLKGESLEDYVENSKNKALLKLLEKCGNRCFALNNKAAGEEKEEASKLLMEKLWEILHGDGSRPCTEKGKEGERGKNCPAPCYAGFSSKASMTGGHLTSVGKSATGNTLLGREKFHSAFSAKPTTQKVEKESGEFKGQRFSVIDTPAVSSKLCKSSPYVLVLVITVGRFTPEDEEIAKMVKKVSRKKFGKRMLVLFTHKEDLKGESLEDYVENSKNKALLKLVKKCGNRCFALNNKAAGEEKEEASKLLMEKLWQILHGDGSRPCTEKGKEEERGKN